MSQAELVEAAYAFDKLRYHSSNRCSPIFISCLELFWRFARTIFYNSATFEDKEAYKLFHNSFIPTQRTES